MDFKNFKNKHEGKRCFVIGNGPSLNKLDMSKLKDEEYMDGVKPHQDQIDNWYKARREFLDENPMPFDLVNYCSSEYPLYILAIPNIMLNANRGYPEIIDPEFFNKGYDVAKNKLIDFCKTYFPDVELKLEWYLSSYWG